MTMTLTERLRQARDRVHQINFDELEELVENHEELLLLDVRERDEYNRGHIPGALPVPHDRLETAANPNSATRDETLMAARHGSSVVVYCNNGERSTLAADTLMHLGYPEVYCLDGGLDHQRPDGLVVVAD